jgi:hypothetical protein
MKIIKSGYFIFSLITIISACILFSLIKYVENEGFCPADDGVVLAQAYRIYNGELPHITFISTKPVFSGVIHSFLFSLPFSPEVSARWMTVLEFLVYTFIWTVLLFSLFETGFIITPKKEVVFFVITGIFISLLNIGNFILFPATTIDAVFFSVAGTACYFRSFRVKPQGSKQLLLTICGLIIASLAALSRQSFIFIPFLMFIDAFIRFFRTVSLFKIIVLLIIGLLPFWTYLYYLLHYDATLNFLQQLSGRTEFFDTAIFRLVKSFIKSKLLIVNVSIIIFIFWKTTGRGGKLSFNINLLKEFISNNKIAVAVILMLYFLITISFSFNLFLVEDRMYIDRQFEIFWMLVVVTIIAFTGFELPSNVRYLLTALIIISWCSSISLGVNSPVFTVGLLAGTLLVLIIYLIKNLDLKLHYFNERIFVRLSVVTIAVFIIVAIYGQRKVNYYDLPSGELKHSLDEIIEGFGGVRSNSLTYEYYQNLMSIYNHYPGMKDNFVILPNNAAIYPLLKSRNPFPVDWMQHDEYIGSEEFLYKKIKEVLDRNSIYVIIDKYDSQNMPFSLTQADYNGHQDSDLFIKRYNVEKYDYMKVLMPRCVEIPDSSKYFRIYRTI